MQAHRPRLDPVEPLSPDYRTASPDRLGRSEEDIQPSGKQFVTVEDSMGIINLSQGFFPPASPQLMSDVAILANLAHATLGSRTTTNWLGFAADYNLIRDAISRVIPGFEDFNA
jgi:hypothetical protein